jgi:hypothetical protein
LSDCYLHHFPGYEISLKLLSPGEYPNDMEWTADVMDAIDELRTVIQPLSADLLIGCRDKNIRWRDGNVKPPFPRWFIHESGLPETVILEPGLKDPQISQAPELNRETLMAWIENALQQECPNSDTHETSWYDLYINAVRARIINKENLRGSQSFRLETDRGEYEFPLERRKDGLWVHSPINEFKTEPSFNLLIINQEGALQIHINIHWSLWTINGSANHEALRQAFLRIISKGWKLTHCNEYFEIYT